MSIGLNRSMQPLEGVNQDKIDRDVHVRLDPGRSRLYKAHPSLKTQIARDGWRQSHESTRMYALQRGSARN